MFKVYIPSIWYYDQMDFILEHTTIRESTDSICNKSRPALPCVAEEDYTPLIDTFIIDEPEFRAVSSVITRYLNIK